jgi:hypothetical protein
MIRTAADANARVVAAAQERLASQCSYAYYFRDVKMHYSGGILTVRGRVPTYYLKELCRHGKDTAFFRLSANRR